MTQKATTAYCNAAAKSLARSLSADQPGDWRPTTFEPSMTRSR